MMTTARRRALTIRAAARLAARGTGETTAQVLARWAAAARLEAENATMRRRIADLTWNAQLNCPKREALAEAWPALPHAAYRLILLDLDGLNALNYAYGWAGVDRRIAAVWEGIRSHLRAGDLHGQWMGGDEFIIVVPAEDALGLALRVQELLALVGLSASRAIVPAGADLAATVARAERLLKQGRGGARGEGQRGICVQEEDDR